ncbi:erythromycin esterase family protein [Bacillus salitolerans]|uniref:Erythromycin esterase family protein n=1 Tax=Bacillus salitolerans TaxID=1437434 RepID=A0ABW4LWX6_9BACI
MILTKNVTDAIRKFSLPYRNQSDLSPLLQEISDVKLVLLGEASHGTSEFYTTRTEITKRLIQEKRFSFIAVEGDWPSCYEVNRYIKGYDTPYQNSREALMAFNRWPTWMWANEEVLELIEWLKDYNETQDQKVGFYGLDVYSLWESMEAIIGYLQQIQSPDLEKAIKAFECFEPFHKQPEQYAVSSALYGEDCMQEVADLLKDIQNNRKLYEEDAEASLNVLVNALVARNAEHYYHTMVTNDNESWNIRDHHMVEALQYIFHFYGDHSKGIVWEHNTHIGDARATDMKREGLVNVGQLTREKYGSQHVYAVGFGTHRGTVIAANKWGNPYKLMSVPEAVEGSFEYYLKQTGDGDKVLLFNESNRRDFNETIGHRAIGVVYHPESEHLGNYVPTQMADRYDAFIFHEVTKGVSPIQQS